MEISDGCVIGIAKAWIGQNENGTWDTNELPLAGVEFKVINDQQEHEIADKSISDKSGEASLFTFLYKWNYFHGKNLVKISNTTDWISSHDPGTCGYFRRRVTSNTGSYYLFGFIKLSLPSG
jgi:hypothetical protein